MKTLVIVAHPDLETSTVNRHRMEELEKYPELFTVHRLYQKYPDGRIDIAAEQALVEQHGNLVLQFPVFWFSCPAFLKEWMDRVLAFGWAFGPQPEADKMRGRKVALGISAGIKCEEFGPGTRHAHTLEELMWPFEAMCRYVDAHYCGVHALYGAEAGALSDQVLDADARQYVRFLKEL